MSGFDADTRLRRALASSALRAGVAISIVRSETTRWSSATFNGARHELTLTTRSGDQAERWLSELPEADLPMVDHLIADLKIVATRQAGTDLTVTLEALTVEDR